MAEQQLGTDGIRLSDEDRARMARLREEIMERVAEMSRVIAATLEQGPGEDNRVERIEGSEELLGSVSALFEEGGVQEGEAQWTVRVPLAPGAVRSSGGCYKDPPGVCFSCTCYPN
jgi:hypothetical protein